MPIVGRNMHLKICTGETSKQVRKHGFHIGSHWTEKGQLLKVSAVYHKNGVEGLTFYYYCYFKNHLPVLLPFPLLSKDKAADHLHAVFQNFTS